MLPELLVLDLREGQHRLIHLNLPAEPRHVFFEFHGFADSDSVFRELAHLGSEDGLVEDFVVLADGELEDVGLVWGDLLRFALVAHHLQALNGREEFWDYWEFLVGQGCHTLAGVGLQ